MGKNKVVGFVTLKKRHARGTKKGKRKKAPITQPTRRRKAFNIRASQTKHEKPWTHTGTAEANEENFHGTVNAQTTVASSKTAGSTHYGTVNSQASVNSQNTMLFNVNVPVAEQLSPSSSKAFAATFNVAVASQSMVDHQSSWQFILSSMFSPQWTVTGTTATTQLLNFFGAVSSAATTETQNTWLLTRFGVAAPNFVISSDKAWAFGVHQLINVATTTQTGNTWLLSRFGVANPGFVLSTDRAWAFGVQQILNAVLGSTGTYSNVAGDGGDGASSGTTGGPPRTFPVTDSGVGLELASAEDEFTFMPFIDTTYEVQVYLYSNLVETQSVTVKYSLNRLNETVWSETGTFQVSPKSYLPVTFEFPVENEGEYTVQLQVVSHEPSQAVTKTFHAKSGLFQLIPYICIFLFIAIVISKRKKRKR